MQTPQPIPFGITATDTITSFGDPQVKRWQPFQLYHIENISPWHWHPTLLFKSTRKHKRNKKNEQARRKLCTTFTSRKQSREFVLKTKFEDFLPPHNNLNQFEELFFSESVIKILLTLFFSLLFLRRLFTPPLSSSFSLRASHSALGAGGGNHDRWVAGKMCLFFNENKH